MTKNKPSADKWERQKSESSKAYAAFCSYRDMGVSRSLVKIVNIVYGESTEGKLSVNLRQLSTWSSKYGWVARVEAYDDYLESKERHENELAIKKMAKQHAGEALLMQKVGLDRLKAIKVDELSPRDTVLFVKTGIDIERLARGAPDQIVELGGEVKGSGVVVYLPDNGRDADKQDDSE